jgi:hypothetical protein
MYNALGSQLRTQISGVIHSNGRFDRYTPSIDPTGLFTAT